MRKSSCYDITLTPLDRYYFGQEVVFGGADSDERRRSYLVHSAVLPQQTTLLGLVRERLLHANDLLIDKTTSAADRATAAKYVGNVGFDFSSSLDPRSSPYGYVLGLSPLLLVDEGDRKWQPRPLDDLSTPELAWTRKGGAWELRNLDYKAGVGLRFGLADGGETNSLDECFAAQAVTGNRISNRSYRQNEDESGDEGLFRQTTRRGSFSNFAAARSVGKDGTSTLGRSMSLAFRLEVDDVLFEEGEMFSSGVVTMGGERSAFRMCVKLAGEGVSLADWVPPTRYANHVPIIDEGYTRLLFTSDTMVNGSVLGRDDIFLLGNVKPFRFFTAPLHETTYFNDLRRGRSTVGRRQSRRYNLIERGSVLLLPDAIFDQVKDEISSFRPLHQIGYNYVQSPIPKSAT